MNILRTHCSHAVLDLCLVNATALRVFFQRYDFITMASASSDGAQAGRKRRPPRSEAPAVSAPVCEGCAGDEFVLRGGFLEKTTVIEKLHLLCDRKFFNKSSIQCVELVLDRSSSSVCDTAIERFISFRSDSYGRPRTHSTPNHYFVSGRKTRRRGRPGRVA